MRIKDLPKTRSVDKLNYPLIPLMEQLKLVNFGQL